MSGRRLRRGLVLLEVMVALVILALCGVGALELAHQSHVLVADAREWADAVAYAEDGMEVAKLGGDAKWAAGGEALPGGFRRRIVRRSLATGLSREEVIVTVFLPEGGQFDLHRLARIADDGSEQW